MSETHRTELKQNLTRNLDLVEREGSGIPRILEYYGKECLIFSDNVLRMSIPFTVQIGIETGIERSVENVVRFEKMTNRQKEVLSLMVENETTTYEESERKFRNIFR